MGNFKGFHVAQCKLSGAENAEVSYYNSNPASFFVFNISKQAFSKLVPLLMRKLIQNEWPYFNTDF